MIRPPTAPTLPEQEAAAANDDPSDVALLALVGASVELAGVYHIAADRLIRLQDWVTDQAALADRPQK
jgi:hypothetical protein